MLVGVAAVGIGVVVAAWAMRETVGAPPAAPVAAPIRQTLSVWLTVQKMRDGKPYQNEFVASGREVFGDGWKFRLNAQSPDRTALYVVNEGPGPDGATTLHLLFPTPRINDGSEFLTAGVAMQTGWYVLNEHQGTENFWLVASQEPVPELEVVKGVVNDSDLGVVSDVARISAIQALFARGSKRPPSMEKDRNKHTILRSPDTVLVYLMELTHN